LPKSPSQVDRELLASRDERAKGSRQFAFRSTCTLTSDPAEDIPNVGVKFIKDS
jgi:hypothetical protein